MQFLVNAIIPPGFFDYKTLTLKSTIQPFEIQKLLVKLYFDIQHLFRDISYYTTESFIIRNLFQDISYCKTGYVII